MGDRFHIIITGEDGRSSTFQYSRRNVFVTVAACTVIFVSACIVSLTAGTTFFSSQNLSQKVDRLKSELARNEKAAAIYQAQIAKLEESKNDQIASLKRDTNTSCTASRPCTMWRTPTCSLKMSN